MEKLNFRDWLEERGCLLPYVRARLTDTDWGDSSSAPDIDDPETWMLKAFWSMSTLEGCTYWGAVDIAWGEALRSHAVKAVPGLPINDRLGMTLLLAELEDGK